MLDRKSNGGEKPESGASVGESSAGRRFGIDQGVTADRVRDLVDMCSNDRNVLDAAAAQMRRF